MQSQAQELYVAYVGIVGFGRRILDKLPFAGIGVSERTKKLSIFNFNFRIGSLGSSDVRQAENCPYSQPSVVRYSPATLDYLAQFSQT
jgi:hypothetical protein